MKNLKLIAIVTLFFISLSAFTPIDGSYTIVTNASQLKWTGYHLAKSYEHNGNVKIKSGSLAVADGKITSGEFVIDMTTISNNDLTDTKDNAKLVNHLKSDDFFNVKKFPEAKLVIKSSESSGSNLKVKADLTIRGITKPIEFGAVISEKEAGMLEANAELIIQRTDFEVMYGWKVENAMLSGEFKMEVRLVAKK